MGAGRTSRLRPCPSARAGVASARATRSPALQGRTKCGSAQTRAKSWRRGSKKSAEDRGDRSGRRWLWPALYPGAREGRSPLVSSIRETHRPSGSEATWRHDEQGAATGASASRRRQAGRGTTAMPRPVKKAPAGGSASRHSGTRRDPGPSASGEVYVIKREGSKPPARDAARLGSREPGAALAART
jgi:hypothetical protein